MKLKDKLIELFGLEEANFSHWQSDLYIDFREDVYEWLQNYYVSLFNCSKDHFVKKFYSDNFKCHKIEVVFGKNHEYENHN